MDSNPPTIPIQLSSLFDDMGFIAMNPDGSKPCIKGRYYADGSTWKGWIMRRWDGEKPERTMVFIRKTCEAASQAVIQYQHTVFFDIIISKIVKLRDGILYVRKAYDSNIVAKNSFDDSIMLLDLRLPTSVKIQMGVTLGIERTRSDDSPQTPADAPVTGSLPSETSTHHSPDHNTYISTGTPKQVPSRGLRVYRA